MDYIKVEYVIFNCFNFIKLIEFYDETMNKEIEVWNRLLLLTPCDIMNKLLL